MRCHQNDAVLCHAGQQLAQAHALLGVKAGGRLVQNQQLGVAQQGSGQQQALLHAAAVRRQPLVELVGQVDGRGHARDLAGHGGARDLLQRGHVGEKAATGVAVVQALLLRHIAEHAAERNAVRGAVAPQHLARIGGQSAGDDADQRAFARAVRPQKAIQARAEGERHPSQSLFGFRFALPAAVQQRCGQQISFAQIVQFQLHGRCTLSLCRVFMLCLHGSTGLFRSCFFLGGWVDSALHRFVGVFPCPQRCGSRYVLR